MLDSISLALDLLFSGDTLFYILIGTLIGIFIGGLPGIGPSIGMAILLPLTLFLDGVTALIFLVAIYGGAMYGGCISAILINAPGTGSAAATALDGYPLSRKGQAIPALAMSVISSSVGGSVAVVLLILASPILIEFIIAFGSPEYFLAAVLGISLISILAGGNLLKGIIAGFFGLLLATVGISAVAHPQVRYNFGIIELFDGLSFIAAIIGVFGVAEMLSLSSEKGGIAKNQTNISGSIGSGVRTAIINVKTVVKSSIIGGAIGLIPGAGGSIASFVAYSEAQRSDENPDSFGHGNPRGVISAEAADNATVAGAIIPTIAFGIPGSGATAVLLGGLLMHGLRPGPDMFTSELYMTYAILLSILITNVIILVVGLLFITKAGLITKIDVKIIIPAIMVMSVIGVLSFRNNWIDVFTVVALGVLGYYMKENNYSVIAFILGFVLGPIAESNLHRSLQISGGSPAIFISRPISIVIVIGILLVFFGGPMKRLIVRMRLFR